MYVNVLYVLVIQSKWGMFMFWFTFSNTQSAAHTICSVKTTLDLKEITGKNLRRDYIMYTRMRNDAENFIRARKIS